jgi:hypothetical protein
MWEVFMLAKVRPYHEMLDQEVVENALNTEKMQLLWRPQDCPEKVYNLMLQCWERNPVKRIDFAGVYASLFYLYMDSIL